MSGVVKILLLEDEPLIQLMMQTGLEQAGYCVDTAETCTDARRLLRMGSFDAGVFDFRLPDGNSVELIQDLRREGADLPVILLTAESSAISDSMVETLCLSAVLPKPPDVNAVIASLKASVLTDVPDRPAASWAGEYRIWTATDGADALFDDLDESVKVVLDCRGYEESFLSSVAEEFVQRAGDRVALSGASESLEQHLCGLNEKLICIHALDELAALSRRRNTPAERAALIRSVVRVDGEPRP